MRLTGTSLRGSCRRLLAVAFAVLALHFIPAALSACPNCSEAIGSQKDTGLADGLNYTILAMIGLPFLVVGTVAAITLRAYMRRAGHVPEERGGESAMIGAPGL